MFSSIDFSWFCQIRLSRLKRRRVYSQAGRQAGHSKFSQTLMCTAMLFLRYELMLAKLIRVEPKTISQCEELRGLHLKLQTAHRHNHGLKPSKPQGLETPAQALSRRSEPQPLTCRAVFGKFEWNLIHRDRRCPLVERRTLSAVLASPIEANAKGLEPINKALSSRAARSRAARSLLLVKAGGNFGSPVRIGHQVLDHSRKPNFSKAFSKASRPTYPAWVEPGFPNPTVTTEDR
ncbi:hypothetical protein LZ30DRAFT_768257 [Colletotrichum cereale]|nr:hypothetical protein LZ30DRAFT_768257 [Colletotrichum cereale]